MGEQTTSQNEPIRPVHREEIVFDVSEPLGAGLDSLLLESERKTTNWKLRSPERVAYISMQKAIDRKYRNELTTRQTHLELIAHKPLVVQNPRFVMGDPGSQNIRLLFQVRNTAYLDEILKQVEDQPANLNIAPQREELKHILYTDISIQSLVPRDKRQSVRESLFKKMRDHSYLYSVTAESIAGRDMYQPERFLLPEFELQPKVESEPASPDAP